MCDRVITTNLLQLQLHYMYLRALYVMMWSPPICYITITVTFMYLRALYVMMWSPPICYITITVTLHVSQLQLDALQPSRMTYPVVRYQKLPESQQN